MHSLSLRDKEREEELSKFLLARRVLAHLTLPKGQLSLREKTSETSCSSIPAPTEASAWAAGAAGSQRVMCGPSTVTPSLCPLHRLKVLLQTQF